MITTRMFGGGPAAPGPGALLVAESLPASSSASAVAPTATPPATAARLINVRLVSREEAMALKRLRARGPALEHSPPPIPAPARPLRGYPIVAVSITKR